MKNNKGFVTIGSIIISMLVAVAVFSLWAMVLSSFSAKYGNEDFAGNLSRYTDQRESLNAIVLNASNDTFSDRQFESVSFFTKGSFTAVSTTKNSFGVMKNMISFFQQDSPEGLMPEVVQWLIITSLLIIITLLILSAVFRWQLF